ncbi:hypothetical protein CCR85_11385 [Rhodothalassium salexigens]|uniref:ribonuclease E/G n=1 Tax=Rhodothalassium salexigens TaxID=1086 RepID=UPI0019117E99|nr:ribonuclease E/G [Rhodothalassium salexigens]MBK5912091.1 hypothetical protein [Rhodothalassium salexigens]
MTRPELLLTESPGEMRAALLEDDRVVELGHWRSTGPGGSDDPVRPGAIFRARVTAIDGGKGICRLDLGDGLDAIMPDRQDRRGFTEGALVTVQIAALPSAHDPDKKPVARRRLVLEGRTVTVETGRRVTVSPRFDGDDGHEAALVSALDPVGARVRVTVEAAAAHATPEAVRAEAQALGGMLLTVTEDNSAPCLLLAAPDPVVDALTRLAPAGPATVTVEGRDLARRVRHHLAQSPDTGLALDAWTERADLFAERGVDDAIDDALAAEVDLPGGGSLGIDQTRGGAVIDVNQRGRDGASLETNRLSLNLAAAEHAARQIRLQDLAGQIFIDFVGLKRADDWDRVLAALDAGLARDPRPTRRHQVKAAGLVVVNRQRRGLSLRDRLLTPARPQLSVETRALALVRQGLRTAETERRPGPLVLRAPEAVAGWLDKAEAVCQRLSEQTGRPVRVETGSPAGAHVSTGG